LRCVGLDDCCILDKDSSSARAQSDKYNFVCITSKISCFVSFFFLFSGDNLDHGTNWSNCGTQIKIITTFGMLLMTTYGCGFISCSLAVSFVPALSSSLLALKLLLLFVFRLCGGDRSFCNDDIEEVADPKCRMRVSTIIQSCHLRKFVPEF